MADVINVEAKSDRELLIIVANKVNQIDDKLDHVCLDVKKQGEEAEVLGNKVGVLEERVDNQRWINRGIVGGGITFFVGLLYALLALRK